MRVFSNFTMNRLLQLQALLNPALLRNYSTTTTTTTTKQQLPSQMDANINRTLTFWFSADHDSPEPHKRWFQPSDVFDTQIRDQFTPLIERARTDNELSTLWTQEPKGTLALLILLDQFPRNIYRGSPLSYSSDAQARDVATKAIAKGFDRQLSIMEQFFFYLPLMHDESLLGQVASCSLYENLLHRCPDDSMEKELTRRSSEFAAKHKDVIMRFGRFPSRNEALGRTSTPEEIAYLKEHPGGF